MIEDGAAEKLPEGTTAGDARATPPSAHPASTADELILQAPGIAAAVDPRSPEASGSGIVGPAPEAYDAGVPGVAPEASAPLGIDPSMSGPGVLGEGAAGLPPEAYDPGLNSEPPEGSEATP